MATKAFRQASKHLFFYLSLTWDFIESDFLTFAIPNTSFGIFSAFASSILVDHSSMPMTPTARIFQRIPIVLLFNLGNLLVFDLANQRTIQCVVEDRINKPWRPIPQGRITIDQTRRLMLVVIPAVSIQNYILGVWQQGVLIHLLTWLYNDLGGGDEAFLREFIIAISYGLFNSGSLFVAMGPGHSLNAAGVAWTSIVSGVILTTMQVQDLKDQEGDKTRHRKTIVLFLGEKISRSSIAFFVCFWSCVCVAFWAVGTVATLFIALVAIAVATRVLFIISPKGDAKTWRLWCFWHASLYTLPVVALLKP